jgi:CsoR family transcriptional regulator, copper-sensing transcriptional repressor
MTETTTIPTRGYAADKANYQRRLRRIEGQVRGISRMVDEDV